MVAGITRPDEAKQMTPDPKQTGNYEGLCLDCRLIDCECNVDESGLEREEESDDIEGTE